jgi:3-oxoacyl-[acyl-carrier-protein] synthase-3
LPTAAAIGIETGSIPNGSQLALLGIGSGINVVMLGIEWKQTVSKPRISLRYASGS